MSVLADPPCDPGTGVGGVPCQNAVLVSGCLGNPSASCDVLMGDATQPGSLCADPRFAGTVYCACVNAPLPCPITTFAPCANDPLAYQSLLLQARNAVCSKQPLCINSEQVGGAQNVVYGTVQECGTITNILAQIPPLVYWVIVVAFAMVVYAAVAVRRARTSAPTGGAPEPLHAIMPTF